MVHVIHCNDFDVGFVRRRLKPPGTLKECDTGTETSVNIESVKKECTSECADGADLDQIKELLASVDLGDVG